MIKTAEDLLAEKGSEVISVSPETTIREALKAMVEHKIGAILVKEKETFIGIWTESDLVRNTISEGFDPKTAKIRDYMASPVLSVPHDAPLYSLMDRILGLRFRHLLVEREGQCIGLLSAGDVMKESLRLRTQQLKELDQIVHLEYYEEWKWKRKRRK